MHLAEQMQTLAAAVQEHQLTPIVFTYASTQASIDAHSQALCELVDNLAGMPEISLVGRSLG